MRALHLLLACSATAFAASSGSLTASGHFGRGDTCEVVGKGVVQSAVLYRGLVGLKQLAQRYPKNAGAVDFWGWTALIFASEPLVAGLGSLLERAKVKNIPRRLPQDFDWYKKLPKPQWTPPDWAFPLVWLPVRACQIVAASKAWRVAGRNPAGGGGAFLALIAYQAAADAWTEVFFRHKGVGPGLATQVALDASALVVFERISRLDSNAAAFFSPTLGLLTFATALSYRVWELNGREPLFPAFAGKEEQARGKVGKAADSAKRQAKKATK